MEKFKNIIVKVLAFWAGIGVILINFGQYGIVQLPEWLISLFSAEFQSLLKLSLDSIVESIGYVILVAQTIRGYFALKSSDDQIKSLSTKKAIGLYLNPFKNF